MRRRRGDGLLTRAEEAGPMVVLPRAMTQGN